MKNFVLLLLVALLFAACEKSRDIHDDGIVWKYQGTERMVVASDTRMGSTFYGLMPLYVVQRNGNTNWSMIDNLINGFDDYEYGYEYVMDVKCYDMHITDPRLTVDGSSNKYVLEKLISATAKESEGLPAELNVLAMDTLTIASARPAVDQYWVKIDGSTQWEVLDVAIERFDYQPGYEYVIHAARWSDPAALDKGYSIKRIVSKTQKTSDVPQ